MSRRFDPEPPRCAWCDQRCRNRSELREHEEHHRREEAATHNDQTTMEKAA